MEQTSLTSSKNHPSKNPIARTADYWGEALNYQFFLISCGVIECLGTIHSYRKRYRVSLKIRWISKRVL